MNGSSDLLAHNHGLLDNVLETLDVGQHTISIIFILDAKLTYILVCTELLSRCLGLLGTH